MITIKQTLFVFAVILFSSCHKDTPASIAESISVTGNLALQGNTTYQYGAYVLTSDGGTKYILEKGSIDLAPFVGTHVIMSITNVTHGNTPEKGPDEYNALFVSED